MRLGKNYGILIKKLRVFPRFFLWTMGRYKQKKNSVKRIAQVNISNSTVSADLLTFGIEILDLLALGVY